MPSRPSHEIIDGLLALAAREGLGERVEWADVEAAVAALLDDSLAASDLRRRVGGLNDPEARLTLGDWLERAATARDTDAEDAARPADKVFAPFQAVGLGGAVTGALLTLTGALTLHAGAMVIAAGLLATAATTGGRWRLSRREDAAKKDAKAIRRLAEAVRSGRSG